MVIKSDLKVTNNKLNRILNRKFILTLHSLCLESFTIIKNLALNKAIINARE